MAENRVKVSFTRSELQEKFETTTDPKSLAHLVAILLSRANNFSAAEKLHNEILRIDPNDPRSLLAAATTKRVQGIVDIKNNRLDIGKTHLEQALQYAQDAIQSVLSKGKVLYALRIVEGALSNLRRYEERVECLSEILKMDPLNEQDINNMIYSLNMLRRHERAVEYYDFCEAQDIDVNEFNAKRIAFAYLKMAEKAMKNDNIDLAKQYAVKSQDMAIALNSSEDLQRAQKHIGWITAIFYQRKNNDDMFNNSIR